ncbi:MAG: ribosome recycling factor [Planctomycetota bacterium]|nr:MAG: ribosome recycling factor [Planctomycetota bacterium]
MADEFSVDDLFEELKMEMDDALENFDKQLSVMRTGQATPAILDIVRVDYYGTPTPLNQVAGISVVEGQTLVVKPYDASVIKDIEKAIVMSDIGINPANDGKVIRLTVPTMTEDKRKKLASEASEKAEKAKTVIRNIRRDVNKKIETAQKDKALSEDDSHKLKDDVQNQLKDYENKIISTEKKKIDEILKF